MNQRQEEPLKEPDLEDEQGETRADNAEDFLWTTAIASALGLRPSSKTQASMLIWSVFDSLRYSFLVSFN